MAGDAEYPIEYPFCAECGHSASCHGKDGCDVPLNPIGAAYGEPSTVCGCTRAFMKTLDKSFEDWRAKASPVFRAVIDVCAALIEELPVEQASAQRVFALAQIAEACGSNDAQALHQALDEAVLMKVTDVRIILAGGAALGWAGAHRGSAPSDDIAVGDRVRIVASNGESHPFDGRTGTVVEGGDEFPWQRINKAVPSIHMVELDGDTSGRRLFAKHELRKVNAEN